MSADSCLTLDLVISGMSENDRLQTAWQELLLAWLTALHPDLPPKLSHSGYSVGLTFCDDATIAALNEEWRGKDCPTDVLAFAAQEVLPEEIPSPRPLPQEQLELGDIVVSLDTAARQALEHVHGVEEEVRFLVCHGLLHLLGWDHPDEASLAAMLARQDDLLSNTAHLPLVAADSCGGESPG
ncbi:MAG: rRNA maturation RNase YbeY [Cyanobium sp.]